jgi:hypothetical protein
LDNSQAIEGEYGSNIENIAAVIVTVPIIIIAIEE